MSNVDRWLLPDGIEEVLPPEAANLEFVRRQLLDSFRAWGYELVIPPMVEFLESLLTGTGTDLDLKTFKITDQISGRMMGVRADITPQVARIDAHSLNQAGDVRLCYAGTVLHAKADNMLASRTPISVGAELFGDTAAKGDLEIVSLMIDSIANQSQVPIHIELGDVGIFRQLVRAANLKSSEEDLLFDLIQRKALPDLGAMISKLGVAQEVGKLLLALPNLCGSETQLEQGKEMFKAYPDIVKRLTNLQVVANGIQNRFADIEIYYDLSELRGYNYHTGIVFAAYLKSTGKRVAKGGRYDDVGEVFGRARAATGFDIDLKALTEVVDLNVENEIKVSVTDANLSDNKACWDKISELRNEGYIVVEGFAVGCQKRLVLDGGSWVLEDV